MPRLGCEPGCSHDGNQEASREVLTSAYDPAIHQPLKKAEKLEKQ